MMKKFILGLLVLLVIPLSLIGVTLAWDASPSTNVTGYAIYYGTNSGNYFTRIDVGPYLSLSIPNYNFVSNNTYYFVATAYTEEGIESLPSNEVYWNFPPIYPAPTNLTPINTISNTFILTWESTAPSNSIHTVYFGTVSQKYYGRIVAKNSLNGIFGIRATNNVVYIPTFYFIYERIYYFAMKTSGTNAWESPFSEEIIAVPRL